MIRRSFVGGILAALGAVAGSLFGRRAPASTPLVDVTSTGDVAVRREAAAGQLLQTATIQPERVSIKCGSLEILAEGEPGAGAIPVAGTTILLDGKPFPVRSLTLAGNVHGCWEVTAEFYPHLGEG
jgi:hypothetical protein